MREAETLTGFPPLFTHERVSPGDGKGHPIRSMDAAERTSREGVFDSLMKWRRGRDFEPAVGG